MKEKIDLKPLNLIHFQVAVRRLMIIFRNIWPAMQEQLLLNQNTKKIIQMKH